MDLKLWQKNDGNQKKGVNDMIVLPYLDKVGWLLMLILTFLELKTGGLMPQIQVPIIDREYSLAKQRIAFVKGHLNDIETQLEKIILVQSDKQLKQDVLLILSDVKSAQGELLNVRSCLQCMQRVVEVACRSKSPAS